MCHSGQALTKWLNLVKLLQKTGKHLVFSLNGLTFVQVGFCGFPCA